MGRSYYYFAASLPMISWGSKLPMASEEFLLTAQRLLCEEDRKLVEALLTDNAQDIETSDTVALAWITFNQNLRNEIAWLRAHRAHKDPLKSIHGNKEDEPALREVVLEASRMSNLLESEKLLDQTRWQFLDGLSGGHYYDFEFLMCYGLKLKILEKHHDYQSSKGKEAFEDIRVMELPIQWDTVHI